MTTKKIEVNNCPNCGSGEWVVYACCRPGKDYSSWYVECEDCWAHTKHCKSEDAAVDDWNSGRVAAGDGCGAV